MELFLGIALGVLVTFGATKVRQRKRRPRRTSVPVYDKRIDAMTPTALDRYQIHMANLSETKRAQLRRDLHEKAAPVLGWK